MGESKKYGINTRALHTQKRIELPTGDVMSPIHLTTTYANTVPGESEYFYGRVSNPTREIFERTLASLEGIENYDELPALAMSSGMAAIALIAELTKPDENVVISKDVYGGTTNFFATIARKRGLEVNFCDMYDKEKLESLINNKTKLVSITHVSNVLGTINPVKEIARKAHEVGALIMLDAAQSVPHMPVNVQDLESVSYTHLTLPTSDLV